jgi:hypothetical protein
MRYILNTAVITRPGSYHYAYLSVADGQAWLQKGEYYSAIGYSETVDAFELVVGVKLDANRETVRMSVGDEALVFRLKARIPYTKTKGHLSKEFIAENFELGLLRRVL